jgi:VanZ family protein
MNRSLHAHRSSAWPLAAAWTALIVYASLHPFSGWHWPDQTTGDEWLRLLWLPAPRSSRFDLWANFLAYQPLGLLLAVGWLRDGRSSLGALTLATLAGAGLSLAMEWTQILLPMRVPSRTDLALNGAGALVGAAVAGSLQGLGGIQRWQRLRDRWFVPHGAAGLALLLTWPVGLLFPPPLPFGLGEGLTRASRALGEALAGTALDGWWPEPAAHVTLAPGLEWLGSVLGVLAPCWIGFVMTRHPLHRLVLLAGALAMGVVATTLSTTMNFGPDHALTWITPVLEAALIGAALVGAPLALLPRRAVAALGLVGLTSLIALVAQTGTDPYLASSLQAWEQGRFIRFHGVAQWVGWLWPFAAMLFLLVQVAAPAEPEGRRRR